MADKKVLLLMCHWLGDTFWAMQVVPEIRNKFPNAEIWAGIKPWSGDLLHGLVDKNKILILHNIISDRHREQFSLSGYIKDLKIVKAQAFDLVLDLTCNRYSAIFLFLAGIKKRVGLDLHKLSFLYTLKGPNFPIDRHLSQRPWETIKLICKNAETPKHLSPPKSSVSKEKLEKQLGFNLNEKFALLAPGAGWKEKEWSLDNFAICGKFLLSNGYKILISGSEKERFICSELNKKLYNKPYVFIRQLSDFIALLPYISIAITNDSGTAHLCAATKVKLITIFLVDNNKIYCPIRRLFTK